jgi:uncharacterized protein DUF4352
MERLRAFWNRGWFAKVIVSIVGLLVVCCVIGILVPKRTPAPAATQPTAATAALVADQPTTVPEPTAAPAAAEEPTAAPEPTDAPTAAPVPTEPPAPPSIAGVGDRVEANGMALTVLKVDQVKEIGKFQKAKAGNVFVLAEVVIENIDQDEIPYNPFYFKVKDADGFEYNVTINTADQSLKSGKLTKGDKARGSVVFEVKEGATGLVMQYKPIVLFSGDEAIKIKLN